MTLSPIPVMTPPPPQLNKPAQVEMIYAGNGRSVAAIIIRPGSSDLYAKLYGMLPDGARCMPLLAKSWHVHAVICTRDWAEDNLTRPKGTPIEIG